MQDINVGIRYRIVQTGLRVVNSVIVTALLCPARSAAQDAQQVVVTSSIAERALRDAPYAISVVDA